MEKARKHTKNIRRTKFSIEGRKNLKRIKYETRLGEPNGPIGEPNRPMSTNPKKVEPIFRLGP